MNTYLLKGKHTMAWAIEATTGSMPPFGLYIMECTEVGDPEPPQNTDFGDTDQVKFTFKILKVIDSDDEEAEDFVGQDTYGWANFTFGPKAKLRNWSAALIGREIEDGESVKPSQLIGQRARVTVGPTQTGKRKIATLMPFTTKSKNGKTKTTNLPPPTDPEGFEDADDEDEAF